MREVVLSEVDETLAHELELVKARKVKVYKTSAPGAGAGAGANTDTDVFFVTTSKDIHLFLGQLSEVSKFCLVRLILSQLKSGEVSSLLLRENEEKPGATFVTLSKESDGFNLAYIIHLAPAH
ncbi:MAG: hypothetical protein WDZ64_01490 [Parcubacteria group bacterium]